MALTACPECSQQISDKAYACPGCGYPVSSVAKRNFGWSGVAHTWLTASAIQGVVAFIAIAVVAIVWILKSSG